MRLHCFLIASFLALPACNRAPAPSEPSPENAPAAGSQVPASATVAAPATAVPANASTAAPRPSPMPEGSFASYQCDDGTQVNVHFDGIAATVAWPDGRSARLSQPASVSRGQPQVYSDGKVRIERAADGLHLRNGGAAGTLCTETEASA